MKFPNSCFSFLAVFLLMTFSLQGQPFHSPIVCGNQVFEDILDRNYPDLKQAIRSTFENAKYASRGNTGPYTINVIVHVVWNGEDENLHDSIILDQFRVLNEDFNQLNEDLSQVRDPFIPYIGNAQINFELAGIERVQTNSLFAIDLLGTNLLAEVKSSEMGGSDAYDPEKYLNIWICKIQPIEIFGVVVGQILGFAFPPNGLEHWPDGSSAPNPSEDGVVIDYRVFGSNNPNTIMVPGASSNLVVKGRTPVHEIGHYLGLRHIWGDGSTFGPNDCNQSDGIDDTPYANTQSNFDCDHSRNSCTQIEPAHNGDPLDMIENYMDYSSEDCLVMFTHGQVALMQSVLDGPRKGLVEDVSALNTIATQHNLHIYPNPSSSESIVSLPANSGSRGRITVYDMMGNIVYSSKNINEHQFVIEHSGWVNGQYIVVVSTEKEVHTGWIMKQ